MFDQIDERRRRLLGMATTSIATTSASVPAAAARAARPASTATWGRLKQIDAGVLNIAYAEAGPLNGPVVILLHGWPYDIHAFADATPILTGHGFRVIVPYLRGFGATRFLAPETIRNGQQAAFAVDAIALMDALRIETAVFGGFDWGARAANIVAALWPERCKALVSVSGYDVFRLGTIDAVPLADLDLLLNVNVRGVYLAIQATLPHLLDGGRIITIGSNVAIRTGIRGGSVYQMTKGAVAALVKGAALDLAPRRITVNNIQPGPTDTDITAGMIEALSERCPLGRVAAPSEIAGLISYLAREEAGYITGASLTIDGGFTL